MDWLNTQAISVLQILPIYMGKREKSRNHMTDWKDWNWLRVNKQNVC